MGRKKTDKPSAYAWVAYMITHQPEEMARVRKYGTPSDELIKLSKQPTAMTVTGGKFKLVTFPELLTSRKGQKLLFETLLSIDTHLKSIPIKMYDLFQHVKTTVRHRRSDTQSNLHMVAEAVIHRAACEFKLEVLFAFDSINTWIKAVHGKELGYHTIRKALEFLEESGILKVNEWGVRGNRGKATKIELAPITRESILTYTSDIDDWLLFNDHGMTAVYRRESATRQDVLEAAIHHFADQMIIQEAETLKATENIRSGAFARLFSKSDAKMVEVDTIEEVDDDYFSRLLGELVPTVQETYAVVGQVSSGIRRSSGSGEDRSRSPGEYGNSG